MTPAHRLTPDERANGYHWFPEWDDLMVGPESMEWGDGVDCRCGYERPTAMSPQRRTACDEARWEAMLQPVTLDDLSRCFAISPTG